MAQYLSKSSIDDEACADRSLVGSHAENAGLAKRTVASIGLGFDPGSREALFKVRLLGGRIEAFRTPGLLAVSTLDLLTILPPPKLNRRQVKDFAASPTIMGADWITAPAIDILSQQCSASETVWQVTWEDGRQSEFIFSPIATLGLRMLIGELPKMHPELVLAGDATKN